LSIDYLRADFGVIAIRLIPTYVQTPMTPTPSSPLLAKALERELQKRRISKITAAARVVGVGKRDLRLVLTQKRRPNKRTFDKYAKFLGLSTDAVEAMVDATPSGPPREQIFFSDEVDTAIRAIQDAAVSAVVGKIRPDLIRELSKLPPAVQDQVYLFVESFAANPHAPAVRKAQGKSSPQKSSPKADLSAQRKKLQTATKAAPKTAPKSALKPRPKKPSKLRSQP
jgi:hypothetical protein